MTVAKRTVERALKSSGMVYTILQASYFMEVWLTPALGFDAANGKVRMYGDGRRPISWISYRDVARAAAAAVTEGTARNMVVNQSNRFNDFPIRATWPLLAPEAAVCRVTG